MHLMMVGVNHRTAGVALREKLVLDDNRLNHVTTQLRQLYPSTELVVLSTCNRTEFYLARPPLEPPSAVQMLTYLAQLNQVDQAVLSEAMVQLENEQVIEHLFRVATGLESMVLGEPQVLGQVKRAYETAIGYGSVGSVLHRLFQQAIGVAKRVRTATGIDTGRVSVGSVAVDFAKQIFERFDDKTIVGIGAGELAKPMLRQLVQLQPAKLWLTNRSLSKVQRLAATLGLTAERGGARPFEELDTMWMEADIVLTSTGAHEPILTVDRFRPLWRRRRSRPLFLIDIAVPRDVEPALGRFNNVYLYNIDDLQRVVDRTQNQRSEQATACRAMLADAVRACMGEIQNRDIGQLIRLLRRRLHELANAEQDRTRRKLAATRPEDVSQKIPQLIEEHTQRLVNKILHLPLSRLDRRRREAGLGFYAAALRELFGLGQDQLSSEPEDTKTPLHGSTHLNADEAATRRDVSQPEKAVRSRHIG